jgi:hypothetical protein
MYAAAVLTMAWGLAARSRHSLVYLSMWTNTPPQGLGSEVPEPLDLVLAHHSLQCRSCRAAAGREAANRNLR